jgi:hypothetical protein
MDFDFSKYLAPEAMGIVDRFFWIGFPYKPGEKLFEASLVAKLVRQADENRALPKSVGAANQPTHTLVWRFEWEWNQIHFKSLEDAEAFKSSFLRLWQPPVASRFKFSLGEFRPETERANDDYFHHSD